MGRIDNGDAKLSGGSVSQGRRVGRGSRWKGKIVVNERQRGRRGKGHLCGQKHLSSVTPSVGQVGLKDEGMNDVFAVR